MLKELQEKTKKKGRRQCEETASGHNQGIAFKQLSYVSPAKPAGTAYSSHWKINAGYLLFPPYTKINTSVLAN